MSQFLSPGNKYCEKRCFFFLIMLSYRLSRLNFLFYSSDGLSTNSLALLPSCLSPCIHPALQVHDTLPASWESRGYFQHSTNLSFFSLLLLFLSSSSSLLSILLQSVSTASLSETACFLMSWSWRCMICVTDGQGSLMPSKPSSAHTTDLDPSKSWLSFSKLFFCPKQVVFCLGQLQYCWFPNSTVKLKQLNAAFLPFIRDYGDKRRGPRGYSEKAWENFLFSTFSLVHWL